MKTHVRISTVTRISLGLALLTTGLVVAADLVGLVPLTRDRRREVLNARRNTCDTLAVQYSMAAQESDVPTLQTMMAAYVRRNEHIISLALRDSEGALVATAGQAEPARSAAPGREPIGARMEAPVFKDRTAWATLEVRFRPLAQTAGARRHALELMQLGLFVGLGGFVVYMFFLAAVLRHLEPTSLVPRRIKSALDALVEGLLLLDAEERILLANQSFAAKIGQPARSLVGRRASDLPWLLPATGEVEPELPWATALRVGEVQLSSSVVLETHAGPARTFMVNAAPVHSDDGSTRGVLATFDDVTLVEERNAQLEQTLERLERASQEVRRKNQELEELATRDPLTGCLNRRSLYERFEALWATAERYGHPLACVMLDIDHFKAVNDTHGHACGDTVLQAVAAAVQDVLRKSDLMCRFGGEEFCILLPHTDADGAVRAAERFRRAVEVRDCSGIRVTASFGVSVSGSGATTPQQLIDRADNALYAAKDKGRNCVVHWSNQLAWTPHPASGAEPPPGEGARRAEQAIPLRAVRALAEAVARRDITTGEHCQQVADLCARAAQGLMSPSDIFVLEVAAQLHDIGKLGVPDAVLLKPGKLADQELDLVRRHTRMGVDIISSLFSCPELTEILRNCQARYGGGSHAADLPAGDAIPLGARLLAIADAFSSMTSDRPYRKAMANEEAFDELRRCAGAQFDPQLVERFIATVRGGDATRQGRRAAASTVELGVGLEVERLMDAVTQRDFPVVRANARHLAAVATKQNMPRIAALAAKIERAAAEQPDIVGIVKLLADLMDCCCSDPSRLETDADAPKTGPAPSIPPDSGQPPRDSDGPRLPAQSPSLPTRP